MAVFEPDGTLLWFSPTTVPNLRLAVIDDQSQTVQRLEDVREWERVLRRESIVEPKKAARQRSELPEQLIGSDREVRAPTTGLGENRVDTDIP